MHVVPSWLVRKSIGKLLKGYPQQAIDVRLRTDSELNG